MPESFPSLQGLTTEEVKRSAAAYGYNRSEPKRQFPVWRAIGDLLKEPMVLLLLAAATLYFFSGDRAEALFMLAAIGLVSAISLYQEHRSRNALAALKQLTEPASRVIRNGELLSIPATEIVWGDLVLCEEGSLVPADGSLLQANDFSVNESILSGESLPVFKYTGTDTGDVYQGTQVSSGQAIFRVTAIGANTRLGKIGSRMAGIREEPSPLQRQVSRFVQRMALWGGGIFLLVWGINFLSSRDWLSSLLHSLTLAMSILPEEIPVAFASFMALGAWRLLKKGILVRQTRTVETLGSATVICTDKTGTLSTGHMSLAALYCFPENLHYGSGGWQAPEAAALLELAMWASEPLPFDPMEKALHEAYEKITEKDKRKEYRLVREYPIGGRPPMMTHVLENGQGQRLIASKGAPEALIAAARLEPEKAARVLEAVALLSAQGYRVLGVGEAAPDGQPLPERQQDIRFHFRGLVAFYDPPKENIAGVLEAFYRAGIQVKIITGDNAATTGTLAGQIGFRGREATLNGDELMRLSDEELKQVVSGTQVFSRMFPEAKLRIIEALKARGEIVAMTGDGVNDGPALKAAHIGIAMGKRGADIARQASALVLTNDDLGLMVEAVAMGRKIYSNLKKAVQYIISIHIPIILTVLLPLALGWVYPHLFTPVHIIFLELIMGPTCSIMYENEPMEPNAMQQPPRPPSRHFFQYRELAVSVLQGLLITAGVLLVYRLAVQAGSTEEQTRTLVFISLVSANIFLTLVNRSFYYSMLATLRYRNPLVPLIIVVTVTLTVLLLTVPPLQRFFSFAPVALDLAGMAVLSGLVSTAWLEIGKAFRRRGGPDRSAHINM